MDKDEARRVKRQIAGYVGELLGDRIVASGVGPGATGVGLGLAPLPDGGYGVAVRYRLGLPTARMVARKVAEQVGPTVDVRRTGRIRATPGRAAAVVVAAGRHRARDGRDRPGPAAAPRGLDRARRRQRGDPRCLRRARRGPARAVQLPRARRVAVGLPSATRSSSRAPPTAAPIPRTASGTLAKFEALAAGRTATVDCAVAHLRTSRWTWTTRSAA